MATPPSPVTLGESLAHVSRSDKWTVAVFIQIFVWLGFGWLALTCYAVITQTHPTPVSSNPWLLAFPISFVAYFSVICMVRDYAGLFLPRTPVAVEEKIRHIGICGVGLVVIGGMMTVVVCLQVRDTRVLAACTGVVDGFIVAVVGFWVWLAHTYGGDALDVV